MPSAAMLRTVKAKQVEEGARVAEETMSASALILRVGSLESNVPLVGGKTGVTMTRTATVATAIVGFAAVPQSVGLVKELNTVQKTKRAHTGRHAPSQDSPLRGPNVRMGATHANA